jgi:hypothetical protein
VTDRELWVRVLEAALKSPTNFSGGLFEFADAAVNRAPQAGVTNRCTSRSPQGDWCFKSAGHSDEHEGTYSGWA